MKKIIKSIEPTSLTNWRRANPRGTYDNLTHVEREDIRLKCLEEQHYLCAYCCQSITGENKDCMNEHVIPRNANPTLALDFSNIVASCTNRNQCDSSHGSQLLPLTPLDNDWEDRFKYFLSGRIKGLDDDAIEAVRILNLGDLEVNNRVLIEKRKRFIEALFLTSGINNPSNDLEDDEIVSLLIDELSTAKLGRLESFSPVAISIAKNWN
ncbi:HNH endonuclease family protein [Thiomicrorhabdus lithotrophica]|uniref:TIGR02646 family protein n=1 Tax=Thiomicrorhabdus lithotrophica TaxID=2949997 RepID=A0ABY8CB10_9GAMM|nr:hypothetical protein [Thiomicrorhabdus lithotrophica]WEJ61875.1 hypothetical protein NR989_07590 [Thiomicrorhabdus lithotrophica]